MPTLEQKVVSLVEHAGVLSEKAAAADRAAEAQRAKVAAAIPGVVDALVEHGVIAAADGPRAAEKLADHAQALSLLKKVAAHRTTAGLGREVQPERPEKAAAAAPARGRMHFIGSPDGERESDRLFNDLFGFPPDAN